MSLNTRSGSHFKFTLAVVVIAMVFLGLVGMATIFRWHHLVGLGLYCASMFFTGWGFLLILTRPHDSAYAEVGREIVDVDANLERRMREVSLDVCRRHLSGEFKPGSMLYQVCELSLEPAKMRSAFVEKFGRPIDDPTSVELRREWEESWIKYRHEAEKIGAFGGLAYDRSGRWFRRP